MGLYTFIFQLYTVLHFTNITVEGAVQFDVSCSVIWSWKINAREGSGRERQGGVQAETHL